MAENISNETVECTLGALLLGNLAAAILYGVTCIQAYIYYRKNYKDTPAFRFLIFLLWLLNGLHLAFISHASYYYLVSNFTNISAAASPTWSILIQICLTLITNGLIRIVFGRRVWLLTKRNLVLVGCIAIASGLTFTTGFAYATRAFTLGTFKRWSHISYLVYAWFGSGLAADIMIAASLSISLFRSRTGFAKTESMIRVIIMYAINTCLLITVSFAACFIAYVAWPGCLSYVGLFYSLSPLYLNSLLATLNSRGYVSERFGDVTVELENCSPVVVGQSGLESELKSTFEPATFGRPSSSLMWHPSGGSVNADA